MAQGSLPSQQDMEVDLRRQLNDVFGEFDEFAGLVGGQKQMFGVIPTAGVMNGLNPYSINRLPVNTAIPPASLCLQEMKNVPPLIPPLPVNRNEVENWGCASEASSWHSQGKDDENWNGGKKRKNDRSEDESEAPNKRRETDNTLMRKLFDDDDDDERGDWRSSGNNKPRDGIRTMIMNMQVEPLIPPIDRDAVVTKKEEGEEEGGRKRNESDEVDRRRKDTNGEGGEEEERRTRADGEEMRRKNEEEEEKGKRREKDEKRRRKGDDERKRKREIEEVEKERKRLEVDEKRKKMEESEREEEERRKRKENKRKEKENEERRIKEEEEEEEKKKEAERKKREEEYEKRRLEEEEYAREKENREQEELARRNEEEKQKEVERIRLEEEERRKMELEEAKRLAEDERKKKEEEDIIRREKKKREEEKEKRRKKEEEKDAKKKEDREKGRKEKTGSLLLDNLSHVRLEALKEKEKERKRGGNALHELKDEKGGLSILSNENKRKEDKRIEKNMKSSERSIKKEGEESSRSSPMSSKNSSRVATPIPSLFQPSTSTYSHGGMCSPSSDAAFSYPHCPASCAAAKFIPTSPPKLEHKEDNEGYTNYAKEKKHKGDASSDRVVRFLHYMESSIYFALSVASCHPSKSTDRELSMAGCVLKDTVDLIKHALVLMEKDGNVHLMSRAKILCIRSQSVLNYHMYFVRSNKFPRRAETLASLESQVQEVARDSPKKEENGGSGGKRTGETPNSSNMVTMPMSLWKMKSSQVLTYSHLEWSTMLWNDSVKLVTRSEKHYWNTIDNLIVDTFEWGCPLHVGSSLLHLSHFINTAVSWMRSEYEAEHIRSRQ